MARKITFTDLIKAVKEKADADAQLALQTYKMSVYPAAIQRAEQAEKRLDRLTRQLTKEAKNGLS